jgi:hypothetical protein
MGLRVTFFAVGFNALYWLSRATLGIYLAHHGMALFGFAAGLLAPSSLLAIGVRLNPRLRPALLLVAAVSVLSVSLIGFP